MFFNTHLFKSGGRGLSGPVIFDPGGSVTTRQRPVASVRRARRPDHTADASSWVRGGDARSCTARYTSWCVGAQLVYRRTARDRLRVPSRNATGRSWQPPTSAARAEPQWAAVGPSAHSGLLSSELTSDVVLCRLARRGCATNYAAFWCVGGLTFHENHIRQGKRLCFSAHTCLSCCANVVASTDVEATWCVKAAFAGGISSCCVRGSLSRLLILICVAAACCLSWSEPARSLAKRV